MKRTLILVVSLLLLLLPQVGFSQEEEPATEEAIVTETEQGSIPNYAIDEDTETPGSGRSKVRALIDEGVIPEDQQDEFNSARGFAVFPPPSAQQQNSTFSLSLPDSPVPPQKPVSPKPVQ
jgi:hypothetical protein